MGNSLLLILFDGIQQNRNMSGRAKAGGGKKSNNNDNGGRKKPATKKSNNSNNKNEGANTNSNNNDDGRKKSAKGRPARLYTTSLKNDPTSKKAVMTVSGHINTRLRSNPS